MARLPPPSSCRRHAFGIGGGAAREPGAESSRILRASMTPDAGLDLRTPQGGGRIELRRPERSGRGVYSHPFCRRSEDARAGPRSTMRIDEYELFRSRRAKALMDEAGFTTLSCIFRERTGRAAACSDLFSATAVRMGPAAPFIDLVALMDIDGTPDVAFDAGIGASFRPQGAFPVDAAPLRRTCPKSRLQSCLHHRAMRTSTSDVKFLAREGHTFRSREANAVSRL